MSGSATDSAKLAAATKALTEITTMHSDVAAACPYYSEWMAIAKAGLGVHPDHTVASIGTAPVRQEIAE